jgi:hypothetical protein
MLQEIAVDMAVVVVLHCTPNHRSHVATGIVQPLVFYDQNTPPSRTMQTRAEPRILER